MSVKFIPLDLTKLDHLGFFIKLFQDNNKGQDWIDAKVNEILALQDLQKPQFFIATHDGRWFAYIGVVLDIEGLGWVEALSVAGFKRFYTALIALKHFMDYCWHMLAVKKLKAKISDQNKGLERLLRDKAGFKKEGWKIAEEPLPDGTWTGRVEVGMLNPHLSLKLRETRMKTDVLKEHLISTEA